MNEHKELQLVNLIRNGDRSAMSDLYHCYIGYLNALCSRYIKDNDDVRDTLQTSFVKIFSSMDRFQYRGPGSLKAWMSRIVVNEALKFIARNKKTGVFKDELRKDATDTEDEEPMVDEVPASVIQQMIRDLPDGYRSVFNLFAIEEKSHKEIAGLLGITESTSASQFHRAKNILARKIKEYRDRQND